MPPGKAEPAGTAVQTGTGVRLAIASHPRQPQEHSCRPALPTTGSGTLYYFSNPAAGVMEELAPGGTQWRTYLAPWGHIPAFAGTAEMFTTGGATTPYYFVGDHLSSTTALTDQNGNPVETDSYDAWGNRRHPNGNDNPTGCALNPNPPSKSTRGFTSQEELDTLCLVNLNARLYDPTIGRMLSADPIVGHPTMGQSFNRYSYVLNNPLSLTDPTGFKDSSCADLHHCVWQTWGDSAPDWGDWGAGYWGVATDGQVVSAGFVGQVAIAVAGINGAFATGATEVTLYFGVGGPGGTGAEFVVGSNAGGSMGTVPDFTPPQFIPGPGVQCSTGEICGDVEVPASGQNAGSVSCAQLGYQCGPVIQGQAGQFAWFYQWTRSELGAQGINVKIRYLGKVKGVQWIQYRTVTVDGVVVDNNVIDQVTGSSGDYYNSESASPNVFEDSPASPGWDASKSFDVSLVEPNTNGGYTVLGSFSYSYSIDKNGNLTLGQLKRPPN